MAFLLRFSVFLGLILLAAAALAPSLYWGLENLNARGWLPFGDSLSFRRVYSRLVMVATFVMVVVLCLRFHYGNRRDLGYGAKPDRFFRHFGWGLLFGMGSMATMLVCLYALGTHRWQGNATPLWVLLGKGLLSGVAVGILEETFFRGVLIRSLRSQFQAWGVVCISALVYGPLHFVIGRHKVHEVSWDSGWVFLADSLANFAKPGTYGPLLTLVMVGMFLAMLRLWNGHVGACIGVHAGWVALIYLGHKNMVYDPQATLAWLAEPGYNRIIGYFSFFCTTLYCLGFYWLTSSKRGRPAPDLAPHHGA